MKIFISESDRQNARKTALMNIANFFNIPNWDNKTNNELINELGNLKNKSAIDIIKLMKEYFKAYDEWFLFYQKFKKIEQKSKKEYILNDKEQLELSGLIEKREVTLNALQEKFDELQLSKFNRKTFGKNISGIIKNN